MKTSSTQPALFAFLIASSSTGVLAQDYAAMGLHPVQAVQGTPSAAPQLTIGQGQAFQFALPPAWRVGEDGPYALTLIAPDNQALTIMVGNAGMPPGYPPGQFAYDKLGAMQLQQLQLGNARPAQPAPGFAQAVEFDVAYVMNGVYCQGVAKVHAAPAYDTQTLAMTAALSTARQWPSYAGWLPQVAEQVSATNGAAFGARGVMAQNLRNSTAYAAAAQQYRQWSQQNWQGVTDARNASEDRRQAEFRDNLGGVQTWQNPYDGTRAVELPTTHSYYWMDAQQNVLGTDDPGVDPNVGSTQEWRRLVRPAP
ncbi:MAG: hypothetical protein AB7I32_13660 [Gammaproteobacteria bacterium]